jgi:hypothetical protein
MTDNTNPLNPVTPIQAGAVLSASNPLPVTSVATPPTGLTAIAGNATGTTGAVVGTLAGTAGKTTYISGFTVSAVGGEGHSGLIDMSMADGTYVPDVSANVMDNDQAGIGQSGLRQIVGRQMPYVDELAGSFATAIFRAI